MAAGVGGSLYSSTFVFSPFKEENFSEEVRAWHIILLIFNNLVRQAAGR